VPGRREESGARNPWRGRRDEPRDGGVRSGAPKPADKPVDRPAPRVESQRLEPQRQSPPPRPARDSNSDRGGKSGDKDGGKGGDKDFGKSGDKDSGKSGGKRRG
ncbi:MAG: ATP-dependent RNA helicase, partial [Candidatus Eisenbacteria bacterium]|nr:ATP-dependent RNA helicase [Candidatus Eisenbacteria bacterium]